MLDQSVEPVALDLGVMGPSPTLGLVGGLKDLIKIKSQDLNSSNRLLFELAPAHLLGLSGRHEEGVSYCPNRGRLPRHLGNSVLQWKFLGGALRTLGIPGG